MMGKHRISASVSALALAGALALGAPQAMAAGSHSGGHGHGSTDIGKPGDAAEASRTVEVAMTEFAYEPASISVKQGETVRFVVRNAGEQVHEFNIGTASMHADHQEEMLKMMEAGVLEVDTINRDMMRSKGSDGHDGMMAHDDPNSVLLEPGEEAEIVWTFSTDADLQFACNVPGHYESGMHGEFRMGHGGGGQS